MGNCMSGTSRLKRSKSQKNRKKKLKNLANYESILLIDDSGSMTNPVCVSDLSLGTRWELVEKELGGFIGTLIKYDKSGIDLSFLNSDRTLSNCKSSKAVKNLLKKVGPTGGYTPLAAKLGEQLVSYGDKYQAMVEKRRKGEETATVKPANFIVLTDGKPSDGEKNVKNTILAAVNRFAALGAPQHQFGIQFVQFGDDVSATEFLKYMDDELGKNSKTGWDVVDTTKAVPGKPLNIIKVVLGALDKIEDDIDQVTENGYMEKGIRAQPFFMLPNPPATSPA